MTKRLHEGWDYRLYQIYAWGGLAFVVVYLVVSVLVLDTPSLPGRQMFLRLFLPVALYLAGILLYWWWVFLFKGNRELAELSQERERGVPGIQALKSWNTLHQAMAVNGGDVEAFIKTARRANRPVLVWYGIINLLAIWILGPMVLGSLGVFELAPWVWLVGIFVGIALLIVSTPLLAGWSGKGAQDAHLTPLGLALTRTPELRPEAIGHMAGGQSLIPDGPAVVEGERYGRLVHIETIGRHSLTVLQANLPEFQVQSNDGKLAPDEGAPEAVVQALRSLRKAKRWRGVAAHAGAEGIVVQRHSKGTNMWLYDLWLAEYVVGEIGGGE